MQKTKLFQLLNSLSSSEFKRFSKFVQSPFFNTNPSVIKLYQILKSVHPDFETKSLKKEKIYKKLFPKKAFNYHHFANIMTELTHLTEEYILQIELENRSFQKRKIRIDAYGKRNIYTFFEKETRAIIKDMEEQPYRDTVYFREMLDIKRDFFSHQKTAKYTLKEDFLKDTMDLLDNYFALSKLQYTVALKEKTKIVSTKYDVQMLDAVLKFSEPSIKENKGLRAMYAQVLSFQDAPDNTELFYSLKNQFIQNLEQIREIEKKMIFKLIYNYCTRQINAGHFDFNYEFFELSKVGLAQNVFLENERISISSYLNIAGVGGVLQEFTWTQDFLNTYSSFLAIDTKAQVVALGLAQLKFRQKDFNGVIETLSQERFPIIIFETTTRFLLIKTWFEKFLVDPSLSEFVLSHLKASEKFFRREDVLDTMKTEGYINLIKIIKRIINGKMQSNINEKFKKNLLEKIEAYSIVLGKVWIIQKVNEL